MVTGLPTMSVWARSGSAYKWQGDIATWETMDCEVRDRDPGSWSVRMPYNEQASLMQPDRLVTIEFRGTTFTGLFEQLAPQSGENGRPLLEASGSGAYALLGDATAWPDPAATLNTQSVPRYVASGAAETVLRQVLTANFVTRRGDPITIPGTGSRGGTVNLDERFTNLGTLVTKKARRGGLAVDVGLVPDSGTSTSATLQVLFRTPVDRSDRVWLSYGTGSLKTWKQTDQVPSVTRAIVMGGGKGALRAYRSVRDTTAETKWGRSIERTVDARGVTDATKLDEEGQSVLDDGATETTFELDAVEAEGVVYGTDFLVGDSVLVELMTGLSSVQRLSAVKMSANYDTGMRISLVPGQPDNTNPWFRTAKILRKLNRRLANLEREES